MESFADLKSRIGTMNQRSSERVLDCGGKRSATPPSPARKRRRRLALPAQSKNSWRGAGSGSGPD
jgi:hypothetical protein